MLKKKKLKKRITTLLILAMVAMTRSDPGNTKHRLECKKKRVAKKMVINERLNVTIVQI